MKIACIADIHGNHEALSAVLEHLSDSVDIILFLGDVCGYYPYVEECLTLLNKMSVLGVRGNHDQILIDCIVENSMPSAGYDLNYGSALRRSLVDLSQSSKDWLCSLPETLTQEIYGIKIMMCHGTPWDPLQGRVYPDFKDWELFEGMEEDIVLMGQTHYFLEKRVAGKLILNPGSVGQPRDNTDGASYCVLDLDNYSVQNFRIPFDTDKLVSDANQYDPGMTYLTEVLTR